MAGNREPRALQAAGNLSAAPAGLQAGRCYWITYECRDIGYGIETGDGEFVYRGPAGGWGKHEFTPVGGGPAIYLFPDEITGAHGGDQ